MTRQDIPNVPEYFASYINLVEGNIVEALEKYAPQKVFYEKDKFEALKNKVYELGKWPIKDVIQHCIDTERVMAYRALCFSRGDENSLPGFDDKLYAENTLANLRTIDDLLEEYACVRTSTIHLFKHMDNKMILREGIASGISISPLALGFMLIGHGIHHMNIVRERYFPLLS